MSVDLVPSLIGQTIPGLIDGGLATDGTRAWVEKGRYRIGSESTSALINLSAVETTQLIPYVAFDHRRLSLSALESYASSAQPTYTPKALSWSLLKRYYAAYFSAHSIMRAVGRGVVRLEAEQTNYLSELGRIYCDPNFTCSKGTYRIAIGPDRDTPGTALSSIAFGKLVGTDGGNHEAFWREFDRFLDGVAQNAAEKKLPRAAEIAGRIDELQRLTAAEGRNGGTWLSLIRNRINYQHEYGVWFPFGCQESADAIADLGRLKRNHEARLDYDPMKEPIQAFSAATLFIVFLCIDLANEVVARSQPDNTFASAWTRLLRDTGLHKSLAA